MKKYDGDFSSYNPRFLECRVGMSGHNWRWQTDFKIVRNARGEIIEFSRSRRCVRCKTESIKVYDGKTGRILRRTYNYVDDYQVDSTKTIVEPGMAALEALRRSLREGHVEE